MVLGRQQTRVLRGELLENRRLCLPQWNEDEKNGLLVYMPSKHKGSVPAERQCSKERLVRRNPPELDKENHLKAHGNKECVNWFDIRKDRE